MNNSVSEKVECGVPSLRMCCCFCGDFNFNVTKIIRKKRTFGGLLDVMRENKTF
jgi:hypothetical protein